MCTASGDKRVEHGGRAGHLVTAEEEGVLAFYGKRAYETFGNVVVDTVFSVLEVLKIYVRCRSILPPFPSVRLWG